MAERLALEASLKAKLAGLPFGRELTVLYDTVEQAYGDYGRAALGRVDRFYLTTVLLRRPDAAHPWLFERCRMLEAAPDDHLDLWAREHYKSTFGTFAGVIQEILNNPNITVGIFSHTKPVAAKFLLQIKMEFEGNDRLKQIYPEILWPKPERQSPRWSRDEGIIVRRTANPKEATVEAWGLVDGQPTGAHFLLRVYDDVVVPESVTSPEMVKKTTDMHGLSDNLGARDPKTDRKRKWHFGTRYKYGDTYQVLLEKKALEPRVFPATADGKYDGEPVFLSKEALKQIKLAQPDSIFAAQMLLNPAAGLAAMFQREWLKWTDIRPDTLNVYIMCDPASSRKKSSDLTALYAVGIDAGRNKYLLQGYRHKMGLAERWQKIRDLRAKWAAEPGVQNVVVGYERYGLQDALEHFEERQLIEKIGFEIVELAWPREGGNAKYDRIQRLEPDFKNGRFYLIQSDLRTVETIVDGQVSRETLKVDLTANQQRVVAQGQRYRVLKPVRAVNHEGDLYDPQAEFITEYLVYPYVTHDDALDAVSRIYDMSPAPPVLIDLSMTEPEVYADGA